MKYCIVVPVFNAEPYIRPVIEDLLEKTSQDILVVDDGSAIPVSFEKKNPRLNIQRLNDNRGKGHALQWAFKICQQEGYTHVVSFDGDGQHKAQDVELIVETSQNNPEALILGARIFNKDVPGLSQFGRKFSNFWVYYQTGTKISDSQSGFRVYPLRDLVGLKFYCRRYDFEIEVLVRGIWRGLAIREVEVGVEYPKERISHFHKLRDNARITILNIYLIAWSLIFYHRSWPRKITTALVAVPLSVVHPLWLSLFFGLLTCIFLRLNVILMTLCLLALYFI